MRYGVIRDVPEMRPATRQRRLMEAEACDLILEEGQPTAGSQRRLSRLLNGLRSGDEVLVDSLDAFQRTTGELAQLICTFLELGVALRILGSPEAVAPSVENVHKVMTLLADHEARRPSRPPPGAATSRNSGSRRPMSPYQIEYARKLHREGASLRNLSLLFQVSPNEVWQALGD